ncbi:response regulator [Paenibacillus sp. 1P07SE]|uniref:response regulator n=1 Tax=Paenibacillus sp. 1P07SE TaxID=3132209 RepID=UPI0039A542C8
MSSQELRVVIADDELPLREELRFFSWAEHQAALVAEASNGEEALALCQSYKPDVIITDITMPVMDGMTLIRELRRQCPGIQIILLTCHSDFHYVQDALRLGALAYILKVSLDDGELSDALDKARDAIAAERRSRQSLRSEQRAQLAALFAKLLQGQAPAESEWQILPLDGSARFRLVRLQIDTDDRAALAARPGIEARLAKDEDSGAGWYHWTAVSDKEFYGLIREGVGQEAESDSWLLALAADLQHILHLNLPSGTQTDHRSPLCSAGIRLVVSDSFAAADALRAALELSVQWKNTLFYDASSSSLIYTGVPKHLQALDESSAKELHELLRKAGSSADNLCEGLTGDFIDWCQARRPQPAQLKQRMIVWLVDWLRQQDAAELDSFGLATLMEASTLDQFVDRLICSIRSWDQSRERCRIEVRDAVSWIREHLQEPLTLQLIAEQVGLSPHHLSRLFREETGSTVGETITRLRMEKAVELLTQTNMKVYEVADRVGIPSYRYFTQLFRKWTGVPPTDYKRQS